MKEKYKNIHEALIEGLKMHNHQSQLQIYKLYYKAMYNVSLRILNNSQDAEDIMQEAFLNAFQKIDQYNYESSFGAWLKRIVINKSLDLIKKKIVIDQVEIDKIDDSALLKVDNGISETIDLDTESITTEIKNYLQTIPERQRIVFSLSVFEGYDNDEIAAMMRTNVNNVRCLLSRSKEKLKSFVQKHSYLSKRTA